MRYEIDFAPSVERHLEALTARQRKIVYNGIEAHLRSQPNVETRNRKLMRPNPLAPWELRLGDLRVYYRVLEEPTKIVEIAAVGMKRREQLWIAGERADV